MGQLVGLDVGNRILFLITEYIIQDSKMQNDGRVATYCVPVRSSLPHLCIRIFTCRRHIVH